MPSRKKRELENAEKYLHDAQEKLGRFQSGQQMVRGKEKKIVSLKTSIAELERKVLHLHDAASNSSIGQEPMQIDAKVAENLANLAPMASPHGHRSVPSDDIAMLDKVAEVASASSGFAASKPTAHPELETPALQMGLPVPWIVQDHDMGSNFTDLRAVDAVNNPGLNSVQYHDTGPSATDPQAIDTVKKPRPESIQDHVIKISTHQAISAVKNAEPYGVNIGISATGSQVVERMTKASSLKDHIPGRSVDANTFASQAVQPLHIPQGDNFQDHDKGVNWPTSGNLISNIDQGGPAVGVSTAAEDQTNGLDCIIDWPHDDTKNLNCNVEGSLQGEENMCTDNDRCSGDWFWHGNYEVYKDVYSFQIQEYRAGTTSIAENTTQPSFDLESLPTSLRRQDWENQRGVVTHFEQLLIQLKSKQHALLRSLSLGFNGDLRLTKAHMAGIIQSSKDIETLESRIREHSKHTKVKRWGYLAFRNEEDQLVLIDAQETLKGAQEWLADVDPVDIQGIQTEQGIIRISKERITLLLKDITTHSQEMNELATVAKLRADGGGHILDGSEQSMAAKSISAEKVRRVEKSSDLHLGVPCVAAAIPQPLVTQTSEGTSQKDKGQDALESLDNYLRTKDSKQFSYTYQRKACEDVNFFPDVSFTSMEVTKLVFETDRLQTLCEYHRKGKNNFNPDTPIVLYGQGYKGQLVDKASKVEPTHEGHLHCGCPVHEVAMEFFFWKTTHVFSSNPSLSGRSYAMGHLWKFKPSTRSFWNKSFRDYTGLQTEDLLCPDYGTSEYAIRVALTQLHAQVERLKLLRAPLVVQVIFPDTEKDGFIQYGIEMGMKQAQAEEYWGELKSNCQVYPLPFIEPTHRLL